MEQALSRRTVADLVEGADLLREHRAKTQIKALREQNEAMQRELDALHRALGVAEDLRNAPRVKPVARRERTSGLREATPFIMISDCHVGEVVKPETVNGLNSYNPKICRERFGRLKEAVAWEIEHERRAFKMRDVVLWLGGDLITGYIHRELIETNSMSPTQEVLFAQEMCEDQIDSLLAQGFERIIVVCDHGNHGRATDKKQISSGAFNSFEWLMYQSLRRRYEDEPRVEFIISDGNMSYLKIYEFVVRTTHGDSIKYGGGVGGITIPVLKKVSAWNKARYADETFIAHFHQRLTTRGVNLNGSLIGYGPYSQWIGAEPEDAAQGMVLFDSKRGKCHVKDLWCSGETRRRS